MFSTWSRGRKWGVGIAATLVVIVVIVLAVVLTRGSDSLTKHRGAISTDAAPCEQVGLDLLKAGGNAVDVVVGVLLCEGVSSAQSMGLGGGFIMTVYDRANKTSYVLDAREVAPAAASEDMFGKDESLAISHGLGFGVPGELAGYWELHQKFGHLPWADLFEATIKLCEEGVPVIQYVANIIEKKTAKILTSPALSEILLNPKTGQLLKKGDLLKRPKLARTLRVIAKEGKDALYNGSLTKDFVADLKTLGSIITEQDMRDYRPHWGEALIAELPGGLKLLSPKPPGSGALVSHFLQLTANYVEAPLDAHQYHRMTEALKFVYASRTGLADLAFDDADNSIHKLVARLVDQSYANAVRSKIMENGTSQDVNYYGANFSTSVGRGTAHVSVITADLAVSVTSTVNTEYGSMLVSNSTGIIMNNEMDDFSIPGSTSFYGLPPSPANYIKPGKRPLSSMAPSIILNAEGEVVLVIGGSGGPRITSAVSQVALKHLYLKESLKDAIWDMRIHHQLEPMTLQLELGFPEDVAEALTKTYGHVRSELSHTSSSIMAIEVNGENYNPVSDHRREGVSAVI